ncbi:MAG: hypothetical protein QMB11_05525 [Nonlabens sp.]|uniref:hypothetical protein n=1 Tax=Nonlabens sp. TaxID=1888209 RepID=UPI0035A6A8D3
MGFKILKGFILGLIANVMGTFLYVYFATDKGFNYIIKEGYVQGFLGGLIGLGAVLNLVLFFFFLTAKVGKYKKPMQPYEARGVLLATIIAALAVLYFEF